MNIILNRISAVREFSQILKTRRENKGKAKKLPSMITGLCEGALDAFLSAFITEECRDEPSLIIVQDEKSARHIAAALGAYGIHATVYPARDPVLYNMVASHDAEYDRVSALSEISEGNGVVVSVVVVSVVVVVASVVVVTVVSSVVVVVASVVASVVVVVVSSPGFSPHATMARAAISIAATRKTDKNFFMLILLFILRTARAFGQILLYIFYHFLMHLSIVLFVEQVGL